MSRTVIAAIAVAAALAGTAGAASADTLTVKSKSIGCCAPSAATGISWTVERPTSSGTPSGGTTTATVSRVVITKPADANSMLFFRAATTGALIDSVTYDTSVLRTCLTGGRLERMETAADGKEQLTFAFTRMSLVATALKAGWMWDVTRSSGGTIGIC